MSGRVVRAMLVGAVAAGVLALPAVPALGDAPSSGVRGLDIPDWTPPAATATFRSAATGDGGWWVGDPITVDDVVMVGAVWGGTAEPEIEVRTRTGGAWGAWTELHVSDDEGPDEGSPEDRQGRPGTEPLWIGDADGVQVRATSGDGTAPDVQLQAVHVSGGEGLGYQPLEARHGAGAALAATTQPGVVPRGSWDPNDDCAPRDPPRYWSDVRFAVVHHTAGSNDYTHAEADDVVRATCLYHRNTRGWDDVGYNFLIDRYGTIYEGRAGGIREAVLGAHVKGFNGGATGISMMGDFSSVQPPQVMIDALDQLLAWKLDVHHVDPGGTTVEVAGSGTRWPAGQLVEIPTIFTHGDLNYTGCPGLVREHVSQKDLAAPRVLPIGGDKLYGGPPATEQQPVLGVWPSWKVPSTPGAWELEIRNAAGTVVRSATGQSGPIDLTWDMLDAAGNEVAPGSYTATLSSGDATPIVTVFDVLPSTERAGGADSISIPVALSTYGYDDARRAAGGWPQSDAVVIAPTGSHVAALAAPLAASYNAPLLTSPATGLPGSVQQEVSRLGATRGYVIGDTAELSAQVVTDLKAAGVSSVERISGDSIYNTSGRAGWRVVEREGPRDAVLVLGEGPDAATVTTDAVIAAGYAAAREIPLLFIRPDELTEATRWVLEQRDWRDVLVVGGTGVIQHSVLEAAATAGKANVVRLAGGDPYATSKLANDHLWSLRSGASSDPHAIVKGQEVVLAPGARAIDAIAGTVAADRRGAYFLLVHPTDLDSSTPTKVWLHERAADLVYGLAAVDSGRLSDGVVAEVDAILRSAGPNPGDGDGEPWVPAEPFDDIGGSAHHDAIVRVAEAEVAQGCADRLYCPADTVTRAQMATFVAKALVLEPVEGDVFDDVPDGGQHEDYIYALLRAGVVGGYDDGTYRPTERVTRAQMASFLVAAMDLERSDDGSFSDVPAGGAHAGAINALVEAGIAGGYADGTYRPLEPVTRAQMATFVDGMLDRLEAQGAR